MKITALLFAFAVAISLTTLTASAQVFGPAGDATWAGPAPTPPPSAGPAGPLEWCVHGECQPVFYVWLGKKAVAESTLPDGYETLGWAGPCLQEDRNACLDIFNQAYRDLLDNAFRAFRARTVVQP